ncbi:MAG TPA: prolipoprotein diacylglyceryl transferase [Candidatus Hydrogenedentes bacterium]|nr:prolipoprotein diacylglyceryl transferase [Candidatus Hydrogenedentota bacterium]HPG65348.1 prolipoprotein diacylglyceryl transferase [Candidatus Hydrogenedentota bacterium]
MHPCIQIAGRYFASYQVCLALAFAVGGALMLRANRRQPRPLRLGPESILITILGAMLGAKCAHLAIEGPHGPLYTTLFIWRGGYYFHGGLAGGIAAYGLYLRYRGERIAAGLDAIAPYAAFGESITRIGCFLSVCCWGAPVTHAPGVVFLPGSAAYQQHVYHGWIGPDAACSLPVHPFQLYMSLAMLAAFVVLRRHEGKHAFPGEVALQYFVAQSVARFSLDFLRGDLERGAFGLTVTQWMALAVYAAALAGLILAYGRTARRSTPVGIAGQGEETA